MSLRGVLFSGVIAALVHVATAQTSDAVCTQYPWMGNSRSQSPCLVTAYLSSVCLDNPSSAAVDELPEGYHYTSPSAARANPCRCSTVYYSLISACAACQDRIWVPWSTWVTNCTNMVPITIGGYPYRIPTGTSVPAWAYLDIVTNDTFNVANAQAFAATSPLESTMVPTAPVPSTSVASSASRSVFFTSSSDSSSTSSPSVVVVTPTPSSQSDSTSTSSKSNVGPIVGGVIGGVGGLAILIGVALWYFLVYRKKQQRPASAEYAPTAPATPYTDKMDPYGQGHNLATLPNPSAPFYNPNDPSTFPTSAPSPVTSMTPTMANSPPPPTGAYYHQPGAYKGMPEL